ncbi:Zinc finger MYM-type protein 1 [Linum perenne]
MKKDYRIRLEASVDCITWLLHNGLVLRGHDESESSTRKGNFLDLLEFHVRGRDYIESVVLKNAPKNLQMTSPDVQTDIVHAIAAETTKAIINDLGDDLFTILQMAIVLRYVSREGAIVERFLGISHVSDTKALTLKKEIECMLVTHGEINGLKTLILAENSAAYYVHCFAHQLQLTLVAVAKNHCDVSGFFTSVSSLINLVGSSCKRRDNLRDSQAMKVAEALCNGELETGRGLNQEVGLKRPSDTRWGSHFKTLLNLPTIFSSLIDVLGIIEEEGGDSNGEANIMLGLVQTFEFAFILKMMIRVLAITNELSIALQRKDQDILNAMRLVHVAKLRFQDMRDNGWQPLLDDVLSFCSKESLPISNMEDFYFPRNKSKRKAQRITNLHHFQVELFYTIVDMQLQELNNRFDEVNCELLCCVACLNPDDLFVAFDKEKLVRLATFYPDDFSTHDLSYLSFQLDTYIFEMKIDERFKGLKGIAELSRRMVETRKHILYPNVYLLIKLALLLPVATASVERAFSAMGYIKNKLRNRMGDELMNNCLMVYIEKDFAKSLDRENILQYFQNMKSRRGLL